MASVEKNSAKKWVAVGPAVARRPPHISVRAQLAHTALTLGVRRQSVGQDTDEEGMVGVASGQTAFPSDPSSAGASDPVGE